jgi:hypothetical protein
VDVMLGAPGLDFETWDTTEVDRPDPALRYSCKTSAGRRADDLAIGLL